MIRTIIGVDPGLTGSVAVLSWVRKDEPPQVAAGSVTTAVSTAIFDTPIVKTNRGRDFAVPLMVAGLRHIEDVASAHAFIEDQHGFPGQGRTSVGSLMRGYGLWLGILAALGIPYTIVQPAVWKRAMGLPTGSDKQASRLRAMQLYPQMAGELARVRDHGRAEALLIAAYGERKLSGT